MRMRPLSNPLKLIIIGGVLLIIGWIIPLLIVLDLVEPSILLAFAGYAMSVAGLVTGLIGVYTHFPFRRTK